VIDPARLEDSVRRPVAKVPAVFCWTGRGCATRAPWRIQAVQRVTQNADSIAR